MNTSRPSVIVPTFSRSSSTPSNLPIFEPFVGYSSVSTFASTTSPTYSLETNYLSKLGIMLQSTTSSQFSLQLQYFELTVNGNHLYGSCSSWLSFINNDLGLSKYSYEPQLLNISTVGPPTTNFQVISVSCENIAAIKKIIFLLTTFSAGRVDCNRRYWVVNICPGLTAALCTDCEDPCQQRSNVTSVSISPCRSELSSSIQVFSVYYRNVLVAPSIKAFDTTASNSSIQIVASLSSTGILHCGAFSSEYSTPISFYDILQQNYNSETDPFNISTVKVTGLIPSTSYYVYCYTYYGGVNSASSDLIKNWRSINTTCCKTITIERLTTSLYSGSDTSKFISITLNGLPSSSLDMVLSVSNKSTGFYPSRFTFTLGSNPIVYASIRSLPEGAYSYNVRLSGSSAQEYSISYIAGSQFRVIGSDQAPPPPSISSVTFSNDGSYLIAMFDSPTNRGNMSATFPCSLLFQFACARTSLCQWINDTTTFAYIAGSSCVLPNNAFAVSRNATIRPACQIKKPCSTWPKALSTLNTIRRPIMPVKPSVVISSPHTIGACDNLTIDLTSSYGNGGRSWSELNIKVLSSANNSTMVLQRFLDSKYEISPPTAIPHFLIAKGFSYTFTVTLCNFLSACSSSSVSLIATDMSIPIVSISGGPLRQMNRNSLLSLSTFVSVGNCGFQTVPYSFSYQWIVYQSDTPVLSIVSLSKDPSKFILPPYSLQANTVYTVKVTAYIAGTSRSSYYSVNVLVGSGGLHLIVAGGLVRFMKVSSSITLDASNSYDDDQPGIAGQGAGLLYQWSCQLLSPRYNESCRNIFEFSSTQSSSVELLSLKTSSGFKGQVSLTVTDSAGNRATQALISISVLTSSAPLISLQSNINSAKLNPGQRLQLSGNIQVASNSSSAFWSVSDNSISLSAIAASPISFSIFEASTTAYLIIPPFQLLGGSTLVFSLSCKSSDMTETIAAITIVVNSPPKSGYLQVRPSSGLELQTKFLFVNFLWTDDDLPLEYQMGYISSNLMVVLQPKSESSGSSSLLPAGLDSDNNILSCFSQVYDRLNANTSAYFETKVSHGGATFSVEFKSSLVKSNNVSSMSLDDVRRGNALSAYVLNFINCSAAPNCTQLHRLPCRRTINTCGSCKPADFTGQSGDSNTQCYRSSVTLRRSCSDTAQCAYGQECFHSLCVYPMQSCPSDCSGHGNCSYIDSVSGDHIVECRVDNSDCNAVCSCDEGFAGSSCSLTTAESKAVQALRSQLISNVFYQISHEYPSEVAANSWIASITDASQVPSELDNSSATQVLNTNNHILSQAISLQLPPSSLSGVLSSVNSVASAPTKVTTATLLLDTLQSFSSAVASTSVPGQTAYTSVMPAFKVAIFAPDNIQADTLHLSLPAAASDIASRLQPSSVEFPGLENTKIKDSKISIVSINSQLYSGGSSFSSNPLSIFHSGLPCRNKSCDITVYLPNKLRIPAKITTNETVTITCKAGVRYVSNYTCKSVGAVLNTSCDGIISGKIMFHCPSNHFASLCSNLGPSGVADPHSQPICHLVNTSASATICSCRLQKDIASTNRQVAGTSRLLQETFPALSNSSGSMTVTTVLTTIADSAEKTVLSVTDLNAAVIAKEWTVLATIATFIAITIGFMFLGHYLDQKIHHRTQIADHTRSKLGLLDKGTARRQLLPSVSSRPIDATTIDKEIARLEESLPAVLSSKSFMERFLAEIRRHHRWFEAIFHFSPSFPRSLRILSLATHVTIMLFVQSIIYNVSNPDDGSCATYRSQAACQLPKSSFGSGGKQCKWSASDSSCSFIEPTEDITIVIFVAILSAVFSTPIAILEGWIIRKILAAPTFNKEAHSENDEASVEKTSIFSFKKAGTGEKFTALAKLEFARMVASQKSYRESLTTNQRSEFDGNKTFPVIFLTQFDHVYCLPLFSDLEFR